MEPAEDRIPPGVPIQVIAYKCTAKKSLEAHGLKIESSRVITTKAPRADGGEENLNLEVDYVFENCDENELMDRNLAQLIQACVEGVNACLLVFGSSNTIKTEFIQGNEGEGLNGLSSNILEQLFEILDEKSKSGNAGAKTRDSKAYTFYVRMSFVEFYEDNVVDLFNPSNKHVVVTQNECKGVYLKNAKRIGPIRFIDDAMEALKQGKLARNTSTNAHGPVSIFSSTMLKIDLLQAFNTPDQPQATITSSLTIVDLPGSERLARPAASVRMAEGPLLNKALHAFESVCKHVANSKGLEYAPYADSNLTSLLNDALGGNCITTLLLFIAENDYLGTKATLEIGRLLKSAFNYPIVNNEMVQGLSRRHNIETLYLRERSTDAMSGEKNASGMNAKEAVQKIHELEGRIIRENVERLRIKEEKEKLVRTLAECRGKYQQLVESKNHIQKQLIEAEEEKMKISKTLLDLQLENTNMTEKAEQEKYEIVTKLLNAENDILELEMREENKGKKMKDLEEELESISQEKKQLAMEFVSLKTNYVNLNTSHQKELSKNQQLGAELLTLANQKKALTNHTDELEKYKKDMEEQQVELRKQIEKLSTNAAEIKEKLRLELETSEALRSEKIKAELTLQAALVSFEAKKLDMEKNSQSYSRERETELLSLKKNMENELKKIQSQKDSQLDHVKGLEVKLRKYERRMAELETALSRKTETETELSAENSRLTAELQTHQDEYRSKLLRYMEIGQDILTSAGAKGRPRRPSVNQETLEDTLTHGLNSNSNSNGNSNGNSNEEAKKSLNEPRNIKEGASLESVGGQHATNAAEIEVMRQDVTHELVNTYKAKEQETLVQLDSLRKTNHSLIRKNRLLYEKFKEIRYLLEDSVSVKMQLPDLPEEAQLKASEYSELEVEMEKEVVTMREKLRHTQSELSLQQEKNLQSGEAYKTIVLQLERHNEQLNDQLVKLTNEKDKLQNDLDRVAKGQTPSGNASESMAQMKEVQDTLLKKIKELHKATLANATPFFDAAAAAGGGASKTTGRTKTSDEPGGAEIAALQAENESLREKLRAQRGPGNQTMELEESERRCADLMTKNVMLAGELDTYKKHMKTHTAKLQQRIKFLEEQQAL